MHVWVILFGWLKPAALFLYFSRVTLAGAAPFGEDLTVVVGGGGERQPVSRTLPKTRDYHRYIVCWGRAFRNTKWFDSNPRS